MAKRTSFLNSGQSRTLGRAYNEKCHCSHIQYYSHHISGPKISRTVHASHMIIFNQTALLFKQGQTVLLFKPRGQTVLLFTHTAHAYC